MDITLIDPADGRHRPAYFVCTVRGTGGRLAVIRDGADNAARIVPSSTIRFAV